MRHVPIHRLPDPISGLKQQLAQVLAARLEGWCVDYAGAWLRADYSAIAKIRNARIVERNAARASSSQVRAPTGRR